MVWELDRSTKFFVVDPVPPFAIGKIPFTEPSDGVTQLAVAVFEVKLLIESTCPTAPFVFG